ncbi:putative choline dehydrogenase [Chaetomium sp. MPI-SDFR-AT-0129]|nr:putative choline dehydrogenase [Chaetomium sp. MPI-SDFR-AT-0129]
MAPIVNVSLILALSLWLYVPIIQATNPGQLGIMDYPQLTPEEFAQKKFDFIVIGGGTAGLAVAARLSEHPDFTIGVLEAGSPAVGDDDVDIPGLVGRALGTPLDWGFETVPQKSLDGRILEWNRGKVLGGSSALNYMTWNRPARQDYDDWRDLGNAGWGWDDLLPFLKKSERFHEPSEATQKETPVSLHRGVLGRSGPVQVSYPLEYTASHKLWHRTMNSIGVETNNNHLAGSNIGCWTSVTSVDFRNDTRSYAAAAYYRPVSSRPNLFVLTAAEVHEILLVKGEHGPRSWKAEGVRFSHGGAEFTAFAHREVILSAGAVQSPQILELSGIGGSAVLSAAGVTVKVDNPNVGENLQDHLTTTSVFEVDPNLPNPDDLQIDSILAAAREEYEKTRTGLLTILPVSLAYVPAAQFIQPDTLNALLSSTAASTSQSPTSQRDRFRRRRFGDRANELGHVEFIFDLANWGIDKPPITLGGKRYASLLQILQYPFAIGSVHIQPPAVESNSTLPRLTIDPQYFGGRDGHIDLEIALLAHRWAEKFSSAQPMASIIHKQVHPSLDEAKTDEGLRTWLRDNAVTDWHPVGTCAMGGDAGAAGGVVDERLRVYGVKGLRVVDASVMPLQISAHLQATVYAIAEKAAAMILEDNDYE